MDTCVIGAGVAGLTVSLALRRAGLDVELIEQAADGHLAGCSPYAGGMLAPGCEMETAEPLIHRLGTRGLALWSEMGVTVRRAGSLVVAHGRDLPDLHRFGRLTCGHKPADGERIADLEPDLAGRFRTGLFFPDEGHLDPRQAMEELRHLCRDAGVIFRFETDGRGLSGKDDAAWTVDCRGLAARDQLPELRGVRGEMALVQTTEVTLTRPVRLIHPRFPLYIAPRAEGVYMVGATSLESEDGGGVSVRSALELLSAAYSLHPAFGEARLLEMSTGVRPAFPDNLPRIVRRGARRLYVNGFYRHGWLIAPAVAEAVADLVVHDKQETDLVHADQGEWRDTSGSLRYA